MQAPGGPEEDTSGNFKHGGWSVGYWDGFMEKVMGGQMGNPYDLLLGRKTYEIFAAHWPTCYHRKWQAALWRRHDTGLFQTS